MLCARGRSLQAARQAARFRRLHDSEAGTQFTACRLVPFSPQQLFEVVADVDRYSEFVPFCTCAHVAPRADSSHSQRSASRVIRRVSPRAFDAELSVGFNVLRCVPRRGVATAD